MRQVSESAGHNKLPYNISVAQLCTGKSVPLLRWHHESKWAHNISYSEESVGRSRAIKNLPFFCQPILEVTDQTFSVFEDSECQIDRLIRSGIIQTFWFDQFL